MSSTDLYDYVADHPAVDNSVSPPHDAVFKPWTYAQCVGTSAIDEGGCERRLWAALAAEVAHVTRVLSGRRRGDSLSIALDTYFGEHVSARYIDALAPGAPVSRCLFLRFVSALATMSLCAASSVDALYDLATLDIALPRSVFADLVRRFRVPVELEDVLAQCGAGLMPPAYFAALRSSDALHTLESALGLTLAARGTRDCESVADCTRALLAACCVSGNAVPGVVAVTQSSDAELAISAVLRARQQALAKVRVIAPLRVDAPRGPFRIVRSRSDAPPCDGYARQLVASEAPDVTRAVGSMRAGTADVRLDAAAIHMDGAVRVLVVGGSDENLDMAGTLRTFIALRDSRSPPTLCKQPWVKALPQDACAVIALLARHAASAQRLDAALQHADTIAALNARVIAGALSPAAARAQALTLLTTDPPIWHAARIAPALLRLASLSGSPLPPEPLSAPPLGMVPMVDAQPPSAADALKESQARGSPARRRTRSVLEQANSERGRQFRLSGSHLFVAMKVAKSANSCSERSTQRRCRLCMKKTTKMCLQCEVPLCNAAPSDTPPEARAISTCFYKYHSVHTLSTFSRAPSMRGRRNTAPTPPPANCEPPRAAKGEPTNKEHLQPSTPPNTS